MNKKNIINYLLICCSLLSTFCLAFYFLRFHDMPISQKTSDWSNFGSYVAGTVGPLLSLVSVLFILKSINSANENHKSMMEFSKNDKIVSQIKDLAETLKQSLKESFIFESKNILAPYSHTICDRIERLISIGGQLSIKEIATSVIRDGESALKSEITLIIKIINLLDQLSASDREVYKIMIEVKLSDIERAVMYCFACRDLPNDAAFIDSRWPAFRSNFFNR